MTCMLLIIVVMVDDNRKPKGFSLLAGWSWTVRQMNQHQMTSLKWPLKNDCELDGGGRGDHPGRYLPWHGKMTFLIWPVTKRVSIRLITRRGKVFSIREIPQTAHFWRRYPRFSAFPRSFLISLVCTNRVPGITSAIRKNRVQALNRR